MNNFLFRLNPVCKIILLVLFALPVSFSQDVFFPLTILGFLMISGWILAGLSVFSFWKSMKPAIIAAFCLCIFFITTGSLGHTGDIQIGPFGISYKSVFLALSLAFRMLGFAYAAFLFSKTTDPVILTHSLIKFWHVPVQAGYAFLTAYRYIPTFHQEFQKVQLAHEVRGSGQKKNKLSSILSIPSYLLPLMVHAIRSGEQVSMAMEARGFGLYKQKTYYQDVSFGKSEKYTIIITSVFLIISIVVLYQAGLFQAGMGF